MLEHKKWLVFLTFLNKGGTGMRRRVVYAGMIPTVMSAAFIGIAVAEPPSDGTSSMPDTTMHGKGSGPLADTPTPPDERTDLTGGGQGVPEEYATTPVRQGKLREVSDSKWLHQPVVGTQGESIGEIKQVLKDQTTGQIEYVILTPKDSKTPVPLRWGQFEEKNNQLQLKIKKEDLKTALNPLSSKDTSPDIQEYMSQINQLRSEPKLAPSSGTATGVPPVGPWGEDKVSHGGPSGYQALPEGKAPGFEGGQPSSKR